MKFTITYEQKSHYLLIIFFIIYPLASMPFVLREIYAGKRYAFTLLALFYGFIALLYPPTGDFYRYTIDYFFYKEMNFNEFLVAVGFKLDYVLSFLLWGLGKLGIPADLSRFLYVFIGSQITFTLFNNIVDLNPYLRENKKQKFIYFFILLGCNGFLGYMFRFGFSIILMAAAYYLVLIHKKKAGWFIAILAILNHFSFAIFFFGLILLKFRLFRFRVWWPILCIAGSLLLNISFIKNIIAILPLSDIIILRFMSYIDGYWGGDFLEDRSLRYRIGHFLSNFKVYILDYYFIKNYRKNDWSATINFVLFILAFVAPYVTLYDRFMWFMSVLYLLYLPMRYVNMPYMIKQSRILVGVSVIFFMMSFWGNRRHMSFGYESKLLYSTSISIMQTTYTENWISRNVFPDGGFRSIYD